MVIPAASGASTSTVIPFMGGPGESITAQIERFTPLSGVLPGSDMLIVDVRGAGRSGALTCAVLDDASERVVGSRQVEDAARCVLAGRRMIENFFASGRGALVWSRR